MSQGYDVCLKYSMCDLVSDVITCCLKLRACDTGKINSPDKIMFENQKKIENMEIKALHLKYRLAIESIA